MSKITALTANTSLAVADLLVVVDVDDTTMAATGTDKSLKVGDLGTLIRSVPANASSVPSNSGVITSTTLVMTGYGTVWFITPASSGKVMVTICGNVTTATAVATATFGPRYSTGTAPAGGAAVTGTTFGLAGDFTTQPNVAGTHVPFAFNTILALTPATAYWFDLALSTSNASDGASFTNLSFTALEIS